MSLEDAIVKIRPVLLSMSYREASPGKWLKPVGYHCFSFCESTALWANFFVAMTGQIHVYESHVVEPVSSERADSPDFVQRFLFDLKTWEAYTRTSIQPGRRSEFEMEFDMASLLVI